MVDIRKMLTNIRAIPERKFFKNQEGKRRGRKRRGSKIGREKTLKK